jgi:hypothetical protein
VRLPSFFSPARPAAALALVAAVATAAYLRAMWNGYALDDPAILANPLLHAADTLPDVLASAWWWQGGYLYRPLTLFTLAVDQLAGNGAPWLPHAVNIALHAIVAVGVTRLYQRFLPPRAALAAGMLFALLPAHVEAVSTAVGRAELLSALAIVASMLVVTTDAPPTYRTRVIVAVLSAAALASKEGGAATPLLVLAAAWTWPSQRKAALQWAAAALTGTILLLAARFAVLGTLLGDLPHRAFEALSTGGRIMLALAVLPRAAAMLVLPMTPVLDYAPTLATIRQPSLLLAGMGALLVIAAGASVFRHWRRPTPATLGVCIAAATLAPVSNLLFASGVVLAGRTMYAPSIGAGFLVGWALAWGWTTRARTVLPYLAAAVVAWELLMVWRELAVWRSTDAVMRAMAERQPDSYRVAIYRANAALEGGHEAEALAQYRVAIQRFPADWNLLSEAGILALDMHDSSSAIPWLQGAVNGTPNATRARDRLVAVMLARGDTVAATRLLVDGLRSFPSERRWQQQLHDLRR